MSFIPKIQSIVHYNVLPCVASRHWVGVYRNVRNIVANCLNNRVRNHVYTIVRTKQFPACIKSSALLSLQK